MKCLKMVANKYGWSRVTGDIDCPVQVKVPTTYKGWLHFSMCYRRLETLMHASQYLFNFWSARLRI